MIFDITSLADISWLELGIELTEDLVEILSDDIGQNVKAATMGHSNDVRSTSSFSKSIDKSLHAWNDHFETFKAESLLRDPLFSQKLFEFCRSNKSLKRELLFFWSNSSRFGIFKLLSDPFFLLLAGDMHKLDANLAAVSSLETVFDFAEGECCFAGSKSIISRLIEKSCRSPSNMALFWKVEYFIIGASEDIGNGKSSGIFGLSDGERLGSLADSERIKISLEVTSNLIGSNEVFKSDVLFHIFADVTGRFCGASDRSFDFVNCSSCDRRWGLFYGSN